MEAAPRRTPTGVFACAAGASNLHDGEGETMRRATRRWTMALVVVLLAGLAPGSAPAQDDRTQVFNAPTDKVWSVTTSVLTSLGWKVDKEDRAVGWLVTKSRSVNGEDYGVYAKGSK